MDSLKENCKQSRKLQVLALGLPRTGSSSIAAALTTLGYNDVLHGTNIDSPEFWSIVNRAADSSFATLPTYTGKPFTREEWDELFGDSEAATDVASIFATQLIEAYPEAKVILVIRDFDTWYGSIETAVRIYWSFPSQLAFNYLGQFFDPFFGQAIKKIMTGFLEYTSISTFPRKARILYDQHHCRIRQRVPPSQLLEYRMGEGWEPICDFLEKPLPNVPFPKLNDAEALRKRVNTKVRRHLALAASVLAPWILGICTFLVVLRVRFF